MARNSVFYCHLSPVGRQMSIKNSVSNDFLSAVIDNIDVFDCRLPGVVMEKRILRTFLRNTLILMIVCHLSVPN